MNPAYFPYQYAPTTGRANVNAGRSSHPPDQVNYPTYPPRHDGAMTTPTQSPVPPPAGVNKQSIDTPAPTALAGVSAVTPMMSTYLTAHFGSLSPEQMRQVLDILGQRSFTPAMAKSVHSQPISPPNHVLPSPPDHAYNLPCGNGSPGAKTSLPYIHVTKTSVPLANSPFGAVVKNAAVRTPESTTSFSISSKPTPATKVWEAGEKAQIVHTSEPSSTPLLTRFRIGSLVYNDRNRICYPTEKCAVPRQVGKIQQIWRCAKKKCQFCAATAGENGTTDLSAAVAKSHRLRGVKTKTGWRERQPIQQMGVMQSPKSSIHHSPELTAARQRATALLEKRESQTVQVQAPDDFQHYFEATEIPDDPSAALADEFLANSKVCLGGDTTAKITAIDIAAAESGPNTPVPGFLESFAAADEEAPFTVVPAVDTAVSTGDALAPGLQAVVDEAETVQNADHARSEMELVGAAVPTHPAPSPPHIEGAEQLPGSDKAEGGATATDDDDNDEEEVRAAFGQPDLNMSGFAAEDVEKWKEYFGEELVL